MKYMPQKLSKKIKKYTQKFVKKQKPQHIMHTYTYVVQQFIV